MNEDEQVRRAFYHVGAPVVQGCLEKGLLINCTHEVVLRFLPPYIVTRKEVDRALSVLSKVLKKFRPAAA